MIDTPHLLGYSAITYPLRAEGGRDEEENLDCSAVPGLGLGGVTAPAVAETNPVEEEWAKISEKVNSDAEQGLLAPDKGASVLEVSPSGAQPMSSSGGGGGKGTGTRKGHIGTYPERKGVILVTPDAISGLIPTGHAGIVYSSETAIEAVAWSVKALNNNWYDNKTQAYGVTVRTTSRSQDRAAADWAKRQVGKPYSLQYWNINRRDKFYCAHLVWAAFKDTVGVDLNTNAYGEAIHPMELVDNPKTAVIYKMRP